jgi:hypothetical protein
MSFEERVRLIKTFDSLINRGYRGNSYEYAAKMRISRSAFFRLLCYIKTEFEAPIRYCKAKNCYEYCTEGTMYFGFLPSNAFNKVKPKNIHGDENLT